MVTAQKREENLQSVPIAVTALGTDMLESFRVTDIQDLNGLAPNLVMIDQGVRSIPTITIRGISSGVSNNAVDPKVGMYLDGVYIGRSVGAIFDMAEIERVEVLRGPQGTLFGRNATGGAISMITSAPTGEFGLKQDVSAGSNDAFRARTNLNLPAWGALSVRLSYMHDEDGGTADNLIGGQRIDLRPFDPDLGVLKYEDDLGSEDTDAFMLAARLAVNDELTLDYKYDRTDSDTVGNPTQQLGITGGALQPLLELIDSLQPLYGGITNVSTDRLDDVAAATSVQPLEVFGHNLTVSWDITRRGELQEHHRLARDGAGSEHLRSRGHRRLEIHHGPAGRGAERRLRCHLQPGQRAGRQRLVLQPARRRARPRSASSARSCS